MKKHLVTIMATAAATTFAVASSVLPANAGNAFGRQCPKATGGAHGQCVRDLARHHGNSTTTTPTTAPPTTDTTVAPV